MDQRNKFKRSNNRRLSRTIMDQQNMKAKDDNRSPIPSFMTNQKTMVDNTTHSKEEASEH